MTIKKASHTRWLSHEAAVDSVRRAYDALLVDLDREAANPTSSDAENKAKGFKKRLLKYRTLACILLLSDVLPRLANLSRYFQQEKVCINVFLMVHHATPRPDSYLFHTEL